MVLLSALVGLMSCSDDQKYNPVTPDPVQVNLAEVPYPKLSDYRFFLGEINNQIPSEGVIPFQPASELFTDYAEKLRFIWMPNGEMATYQSDHQILDLPVGAALIKTFLYSNSLPSHSRRLIETRLLIRKPSGWIAANYVWNDQQDEAFLDTNGSVVPVSFEHNGQPRNINYQIPGSNQCATCHSRNNEMEPLGIKPQNLNNPFTYGSEAVNQLQKLYETGYLNEVPVQINSVVDYRDTSAPLAARIRSYFDINCAHCHRDGGAAGFLALRFEYFLTTDPENMGVCSNALMQPPGIPHGYIVKPGDISQSVLHYTMTTNNANFKMPRLGRTVVHDEAVSMVSQWINSLPPCN